jgi:hypothetical protein
MHFILHYIFSRPRIYFLWQWKRFSKNKDITQIKYNYNHHNKHLQLTDVTEAPSNQVRNGLNFYSNLKVLIMYLKLPCSTLWFLILHHLQNTLCLLDTKFQKYSVSFVYYCIWDLSQGQQRKDGVGLACKMRICLWPPLHECNIWC